MDEIPDQNNRIRIWFMKQLFLTLTVFTVNYI